jgi:hypothetical protein
MSIITKLESFDHTTVAFLEKVITEIEGKEPEIAQTIDTALTYVTPALQVALAATGDPAAAAVVGTVSAQAQKDLAVASAIVTDLGPSPTAAGLFTAVATNLSGLLTAGHVTSVQSVAAVTKAVSVVGTLASAVSAAAAAISTPATTPA